MTFVLGLGLRPGVGRYGVFAAIVGLCDYPCRKYVPPERQVLVVERGERDGSQNQEGYH